jgi:tRNA(fMet)-specific endonuclease VapC
MKYMLDTNTSIYIMKNKPDFLKRKLQRIKYGNVTVSNISVSELFFGVYSSKNRKRNLKVLENFLLGVDVVDYDFEAAMEYGKIKSQLFDSRQSMKTLNVQIAAHSRSAGSILVTENLSEFKKIKKLKTENWIIKTIN